MHAPSLKSVLAACCSVGRFAQCFLARSMPLPRNASALRYRTMASAASTSARTDAELASAPRCGRSDDEALEPRRMLGLVGTAENGFEAAAD